MWQHSFAAQLAPPASNAKESEKSLAADEMVACPYKPYRRDEHWYILYPTADGKLEEIKGELRVAAREKSRVVLSFQVGKNLAKRFYLCEYCAREEWVDYKNYSCQHIRRHHPEMCVMCPYCSQLVLRKTSLYHKNYCSARKRHALCPGSLRRARLTKQCPSAASTPPSQHETRYALRAGDYDLRYAAPVGSGAKSRLEAGWRERLGGGAAAPLEAAGPRELRSAPQSAARREAWCPDPGELLTRNAADAADAAPDGSKFPVPPRPPPAPHRKGCARSLSDDECFDVHRALSSVEACNTLAQFYGLY